MNILNRFTISNKPTAKTYSIWFDDRLKQFLVESGYSKQIEFTEYLSEYCYFCTVTFDRKKLSERKRLLGSNYGDYTVEFDEFHHMYNWIDRKLFRGSSNRKSTQFKRCLAIACIDYEGSKFSSEAPLVMKNIHIHALWAVHPGEHEKFKSVIGPFWFEHKFLRFMDFDKCVFEPLVTEKITESGGSSYIAKAFRKSGGDLVATADMIRIYPDVLQGPDKIRLKNCFSTRNHHLEKLVNLAANERRRMKSYEQDKKDGSWGNLNDCFSDEPTEL